MLLCSSDWLSIKMWYSDFFTPPQAEADLHEVVEALTRWRNTPVSKRDTVTLPSSLEMEVELTLDRSMGGVEELVEG